MSSLLWLTDNYPPQRGGMAQSCDRIVAGLRNEGMTIDIIHFVSENGRYGSKQQKNGSYTTIPFSNSEAHVLNIAWNRIKTLGPYDYIVCFGGYLSMTGAPIFSLWMETRLITMIRGNDLDTAIFTPRKRSMLEDAFRQSHLITTVSSDKAEKIKKWLHIDHVHFVANGIDSTEWQPTASENAFAEAWRQTNSNNKTCMGIFGQLKAKKGVEFFLNALRKTSLTEKIHLLLIGEIEPEISNLLSALNGTYSILPFHDRYELMKYYMCCDVVAIPSYYDGMPNVLLEAGCLGIPIIASNTDGMADVLTDREDGFLFAPGNDDACRKTLYDFFEVSEQDRTKLGQRLKNKIETNYTLAHEINTIKTLLAQ